MNWELFRQHRTLADTGTSGTDSECRTECVMAEDGRTFCDVSLPLRSSSTAVRSSLEALFLAAGGPANISQDEVVNLLAGPGQESSDGRRVHLLLTGRINSVLEDQRLVSLDTLFALSDGLKEMEQGKGNADALLPLAAELREFDMPRPIFTNSEKVSWARQITPHITRNCRSERI